MSANEATCLHQAVAAMDDLRDAFAAQIECGRVERALICALDHEALLQQAHLRNATNTRIASATRHLQVALLALSGLFGLTTTSVSEIARHSPEVGQLLLPAFQRMLARANELRALDDANRYLLNRVLTIVRGAHRALAPTPVAYNRRGSHVSDSPRVAAGAW
jgi:hypothetical protein